MRSYNKACLHLICLFLAYFLAHSSIILRTRNILFLFFLFYFLCRLIFRFLLYSSRFVLKCALYSTLLFYIYILLLLFYTYAVLHSMHCTTPLPISSFPSPNVLTYSPYPHDPRNNPRHCIYNICHTVPTLYSSQSIHNLPNFNHSQGKKETLSQEVSSLTTILFLTSPQNWNLGPGTVSTNSLDL